MTLTTIDETSKILAFSGDEDENTDDVEKGLGLEGDDPEDPEEEKEEEEKEEADDEDETEEE
ncbi:MAG: hypothetical protein V1686_01910 [Patescibacteria group bacterium]